MKRYLPFIAIIISLTGCASSYSGRLNLREPLKFVNLTSEQVSDRMECQATENQGTKKCINLQKKIEQNTSVIDAGIYDADVVQGDDEITLKILRPGTSRKLGEIPIKTSTGFPERSGTISLLPWQTGRSFGIEGTIDTNVIDSETVRGVENCSVRIPYRWCGYVAVPTGENNQTKQVYRCQTRYETYYGDRQVAYYYHDTNKEVFLDLVRPDGSVIGEYNGTQHSSNKNYTHQGYCNTNYRSYY